MTSAIIRRWGPARLAAVALLLAMVGPAHGQPKGQAPPPPAGPVRPAAPPITPAPLPGKAAPARPAGFDATAAAADLTRPESITAGLAAIQAAGPAAKKLAPAVEDLLVRGLPPELAAAAIAALGAVGERSSSAAIAPYMSHRSAAVRKVAAEALGSTGGPHAAAALAAGLRSSDAAVRDLSAKGLRFASDHESVPDLLRALDRGEPSAAPSIGALCAAERCEELLRRWEVIARRDRAAPGAQVEVLDAMLAREPKLPDDVLLRAMATAGATGSPSAKEYLRSLKKNRKLPWRLRKAAEAAAREPAKPEERAP